MTQSGKTPEQKLIDHFLYATGNGRGYTALFDREGGTVTLERRYTNVPTQKGRNYDQRVIALARALCARDILEESPHSTAHVYYAISGVYLEKHGSSLEKEQLLAAESLLHIIESMGFKTARTEHEIEVLTALIGALKVRLAEKVEAHRQVLETRVYTPLANLEICAEFEHRATWQDMMTEISQSRRLANWQTFYNRALHEKHDPRALAYFKPHIVGLYLGLHILKLAHHDRLIPTDLYPIRTSDMYAQDERSLEPDSLETIVLEAAASKHGLDTSFHNLSGLPVDADSDNSAVQESIDYLYFHGLVRLDGKGDLTITERGRVVLAAQQD